MASRFGYDATGLYKRLPDGRVLRVSKRLFNTSITLSASQQEHWWSDQW